MNALLQTTLNRQEIAFTLARRFGLPEAGELFSRLVMICILVVFGAGRMVSMS